MLAYFFAGIALALCGAYFIARGISQPVEALAKVARSIEAGNYTVAVPTERHSELGQLAVAISTMARAIASRERS